MLLRNIAVVVIMFFLCSNAYCLDWVSLHERASQISFKEARENAEDNPNSLDALYVFGLACLNEYNTDEAQEAFRKILKIDLSIIEAQWGVAECLRRKGQHDICLRLLEEIIASHPEFAPAYLSLSYIKYIDMDFERAVRLAYRVIKLGKDNVDLNNLVRAYCILAGAKGMIAHYGGPISKIINGRVVMPYLKKAQKLQPDAAAVIYGLGSYYLLTPHVFGRNIDKGLEYFKKAIEVDPLFADAYVRLAQAWRAKGDEKKYEFYLKKALELDPKNILALDVKSGTCNFICLE